MEPKPKAHFEDTADEIARAQRASSAVPRRSPLAVSPFQGEARAPSKVARMTYTLGCTNGRIFLCRVRGFRV
jgi:hypothetical protein